MDLGGIEPPLLQCECSVVPLNHRPNVGVLGIEPRPQSPEPCILPLYYTPKKNNELSYPVFRFGHFIFFCFYFFPFFSGFFG